MTRSRLQESGTAHRQVPVAANGWKAEVDERMAPLIEALWRRGIYTEFSCQGNESDDVCDEAYLSMPVDDFMRFLDLAADVFESMRGQSYAFMGSFMVIGDLPEGMKVADPPERACAVASRAEDGWRMRCSLHFRSRLIPQILEAVEGRQCWTSAR